MTMRYNVFPFFNELDLLELRLTELCDHIDKFVIVESTLTFTGNPKPLYYQENASRFAKWANQIIAVNYTPADVSDKEKWWQPRAREAEQRNRTLDGLVDASPNDTVIICDADEIIRPGTIRDGETYWVDMRHYWYWLNAQICDKCKCLATRVCTVAQMRSETPQGMVRKWRYKHADTAIDAGWHFSFLGGVEAIKLKLASCCYEGWHTPEFSNTDHLMDCITNGKDIAGRREFSPLTKVEIDDSYPKALLNDLPKYEKYIWK